jgi:hypothetical protein
MSLGFALAAWIPPEPPTVLVAADTRISSTGGTLTDTGIKIYDLGGGAAMVAAGYALPAMTAAEIVRSIVENHNRGGEGYLGFYDTVRLAAFFLKRFTEQQKEHQRWDSDVVIAGFLQTGKPALASITISMKVNHVRFFSVNEKGTIAIPVGVPDGKQFLLQGLAKAKGDGRPVVVSGLSLLWYVIQHPGAFTSIGGGLSVGTRTFADRYFSWPIIEISGQRFLRGVDVTSFYRQGWPDPIMIDYDESWCAELDAEIHQSGDVMEKSSVDGISYNIDTILSPETLFATHDDPESF